MAPLPLSSYSMLRRMGLCLMPMLLLLLVLQQQQQTVECRYLPTRSHGDDLDKLRELMLQILESSSEDQRQPNDGGSSAVGSSSNNNNNNNNNNNVSPQHASWLNKLNGLEAAASRKYGGNRGGYYDAGRYY